MKSNRYRVVYNGRFYSESIIGTDSDGIVNSIKVKNERGEFIETDLEDVFIDYWTGIFDKNKEPVYDNDNVKFNRKVEGLGDFELSGVVVEVDNTYMILCGDSYIDFDTVINLKAM